MNTNRPLVLIRGGGDLATGVAVRLCRSGFAVVVTEIAAPKALRRLVALAEAVYAGEVMVEEIRGCRVEDLSAAERVLKQGVIPVFIDPTAECRHVLKPVALVDGRMCKTPPELGMDAAPLVIGLGPGFTAGIDCHAVIETNRGHHMGRVFWEGSAEADTAVPEAVAEHNIDRVLRAPVSGQLQGLIPLASRVGKGEIIATINEVPLKAPFDGVLRGLLYSGVTVEAGAKIGDLDPRRESGYCFKISDKSLAVGGGVLEALLSCPTIRSRLGA